VPEIAAITGHSMATVQEILVRGDEAASHSVSW
jgi:hypothetical protein